MDVPEVRSVLSKEIKNIGKDTSFSSDLEKCVDKVINNEDYISYQCETTPISTNGGNLLGVLYKIHINGKTSNGDKESNIFVKKCLKHDNIMKVMAMRDLYQRETFAYSELSKIFSDLQTEANVPENERYKMVKFYDTGISKVIALEDMTTKGFKTYNRMDTVTLQFAEMAIETLAKFHSLSFAIQKQRTDFYETKIKTLRCVYDFNEYLSDYMKNVYAKTLNRLNSDQSKETIKEFSKNVMAKYQKYLEKSLSKTCVLSHGDYRPNNILMKVKNGVPSELLPVDYQMIYYGNPINDFFFFISLSSDHKLRLHLNDLKNLYYDTLSKFLLYFDIDSEDVYPRELFEFDFKDRFGYGLMIGVQMLPFVLANIDKIPDLNEDDISLIDVPNNLEYTKRINELVEDFIRLGYLCKNVKE